MNISERTEFWKMLCSLSADYIENDSKALQTLMKYPRYLYRYRTVTAWILVKRDDAVWLSLRKKRINTSD